MDNQLIPQGIEIVQRAIAADGDGDFEKALALYRDALGRFTLGLKYEKNEARKKLIFDRVEGYMKRAEELSDYLKKQAELDKGGSGGSGGAAVKKPGEGEDDTDAETKKLRGALSSAIVSEKPNVKWEDVAGLENAKESLKEVSVIVSLLGCILLPFALSRGTLVETHIVDEYRMHAVSPCIHKIITMIWFALSKFTTRFVHRLTKM